MRRQVSIALIAVALLAGCASNGKTTADDSTKTQPATGSATTTSAAAGSADSTACSGGLKGTEPGVIRITCDGTADIKIQAGSVSKDMRGGSCQQADGVWSAAVGVVIDATGTQGKYTGPPVDSITVNNTSTGGKATIQAKLGGKTYFDLGTATLSLSSDGKTAHIEGASDHLSDAPGAKLVVDVTC